MVWLKQKMALKPHMNLDKNIAATKAFMQNPCKILVIRKIKLPCLKATAGFF